VKNFELTPISPPSPLRSFSRHYGWTFPERYVCPPVLYISSCVLTPVATSHQLPSRALLRRPALPTSIRLAPCCGVGELWVLFSAVCDSPITLVLLLSSFLFFSLLKGPPVLKSRFVPTAAPSITRKGASTAPHDVGAGTFSLPSADGIS